LTEREARLVEVPWESTATRLELRWDTLPDPGRDWGPPAWLDATKLVELGFDCTVPLTDPQAKEHYRSLPFASVFVVLEYAGETWRNAPVDREKETRLFVVDAGRNAGRLRQRYADTETYIITRGLVRLTYEDRGFRDDAPLASPRLQGWIESVVPGQIYVPQPYSRQLEEFRHRGPPTDKPREGGPRFAVTVAWGSNYEPWVREARRLAPEGAERVNTD
jgi:hypothetical protein